MAVASKRGAVIPAVLWLWLFAHLQAEWTLNSQYNYGWCVPFLGALIFYFRWRSAPAPVGLGKKSARPKIAIWILLLMLLPIRVVEDANPDWRFLSWVLALDVVGVSLLWIYLAGGVAWLRHFAFAFSFPLVAVPWPVRFENIVVQ